MFPLRLQWCWEGSLPGFTPFLGHQLLRLGDGDLVLGQDLLGCNRAFCQPPPFPRPKCPSLCLAGTHWSWQCGGYPWGCWRCLGWGSGLQLSLLYVNNFTMVSYFLFNLGLSTFPKEYGCRLYGLEREESGRAVASVMGP